MIRAKGWRRAVCAIWAGTLGVTTGCGFITDATDRVPSKYPPFTAPARYLTMWRTVEACSGARGDLSTVDFYTLPAGYQVNGRIVDGYWESRGWRQRIFLVGGATASSETVRHEMLHALVQDARHSRRDFIERCGGIVACSSSCFQEAGVNFSAASNSTAPVLSANGFAQSVRVVPAERSDSAWFTVIVSATNPERSVMRMLPLVPTLGFGAGGHSASQSLSPALRELAAGQTIQAAFDILPTALERGTPGEVQGYFNNVPGPKLAIRFP